MFERTRECFLLEGGGGKVLKEFRVVGASEGFHPASHPSPSISTQLKARSVWENRKPGAGSGSSRLAWVLFWEVA